VSIQGFQWKSRGLFEDTVPRFGWRSYKNLSEYSPKSGRDSNLGLHEDVHNLNPRDVKRKLMMMMMMMMMTTIKERKEGDGT
jgi:hypothetical protein